MATIKCEELSDHQGFSASISGNCCLLMVLEVMTELDWRKNFYEHYLDFASHLVHLVKTLIYTYDIQVHLMKSWIRPHCLAPVMCVATCLGPS